MADENQDAEIVTDKGIWLGTKLSALFPAMSFSQGK